MKRVSVPRAFLPGILALLVLSFVAPLALHADEPGAEAVPVAGTDDGAVAADAAEAGVTPKALESWVRESPLALWTLVILKWGSALVGVLLLGLLWRRWDRGRAGFGPPVLPPSAPTQPFDALQALAILVVTVVGGALLIQGAQQAFPDAASSVEFQMASAQALLLPVAFVVVWRRWRLRARSRPSGAWSRVGGAVWTFCVASALVLPVALLTAMLMQALDRDLTVYGPVVHFVEGSGTARPWWIAFFAVVMAPIGEEAVFRGLLYPALRGPRTGESGPVSRRRVILAGVAVSVLFAAIHFHETSFLPLLALALVLTWVFERTNSLAVVMGAHALWNFSTLLPMLLRGIA